MGPRIAIVRPEANEPRPPRPKPEAPPTPWWAAVDWPLLLIILALLVEGTVAIYSTSVAFAVTRTDKPAFYFVVRHAVFVAVGLMLMLIVWRVGYAPLRARPRLVAVLAAGVVASLLVLLLRNRLAGTTGRTLLGGSLQPAEFAKPVLIVYLAVWLTTRRREMPNWRYELVSVGAITGIFALLVLLQPDLSAAATVFALGMMMLFLAGAHSKQVVFTLGVAVLVLAVGIPAMRWIYPVGVTRFRDFWIALRTPAQVEGHLREAIWAFLRGGWFGVGIGEGQSKFYYLPLPHTDSVFAVIGEEWGVLGAILVVGTFGLLLWRGLKVATEAPDPMGRLLAGGIILWLVGEAVLNMAGIVGLLPEAGNVMPFFSYGGSNLTVTLASLGLVLSVAGEARRASRAQGGPNRAVVDLRRGNRRRRVSRAGRMAAPGA
ncbi:MAG: FtsW/RodA/SpoVE family cell cycle protein [Chloroflexi bacterium]|nr:FtsW/RodA/SpoVE family cell cycle protein [Chloroflexota bacterium]